MNRRYFFIVLALTLFFLILILIFFGQKSSSKPQVNIQTDRFDRSPFQTSISGVGIIEPKSGNIYIGIPFNRIVKKINVSVNEKVKKGDFLFQLDHQDLVANLQVKKKEYKKTLAHLYKLEELPLKEDLVIAQEALKKAQVALNESKVQYEMVNNLSNPRAISKQEYDKRFYKYERAVVELREQEAQFEKIKAGTPQSELTIASYEVEQAKAAVRAIESEIQRTYIKAPIDGTVLQIKIHEGEMPNSDPEKIAMILGNIEEVYLRVSIDQYNAFILDPNVSAVAFRQGDHQTQFPLEFIHIEPFMVHKKYLTNAADEKVDTQVFEILYRIAKNDTRLFIGEQMDVYIDVVNN
jgi:HlyD family secretion protein